MKEKCKLLKTNGLIHKTVNRRQKYFFSKKSLFVSISLFKIIYIKNFCRVKFKIHLI